MVRFRIRTNWTNSVSRTHEFELDDLADAATRDRLKWAFSDPERLRPGETRQALTERVAASFASVAQALRERGHDPQAVAHFVNRLVFCMFADDVGLLPHHMFTRTLEQARLIPKSFTDLATTLFRGMAKGGLVGIEPVDWFNGGLFDDDKTLPMERSDIDTVLSASKLDWSEIDPSILGTLFERGLDPDKRAQLGAHYTDRDKIMLLVEPVVIRPLLADWNAEKTEIAAELERAETAKSRPARAKRLNEAERRYRAFLNRLREFTVLDPACGSGNFLYLALQALKDLEHRVQFEAEALGFPRQFSCVVGPANVKGIETNPYAAELARVSVWIGEIQWMRRNGYGEARNPILKPLDTIEYRPLKVHPPDPDVDLKAVADVHPLGVPIFGGLATDELGLDRVPRRQPGGLTRHEIGGHLGSLVVAGGHRGPVERPDRGPGGLRLVGLAFVVRPRRRRRRVLEDLVDAGTLGPRRQLHRRQRGRGRRVLDADLGEVGAGTLGPRRQLHRRQRGRGRRVLDADLGEVGAGTLGPRRQLHRRQRGRGCRVLDADLGEVGAGTLGPRRQLRRHRHDYCQTLEPIGALAETSQPPDVAAEVCQLGPALLYGGPLFSVLALFRRELGALEGGHRGRRSVREPHALALELGRRPVLEPRADVDPSLLLFVELRDVGEFDSVVVVGRG